MVKLPRVAGQLADKSHQLADESSHIRALVRSADYRLRRQQYVRNAHDGNPRNFASVVEVCVRTISTTTLPSSVTVSATDSFT